MPGGANASRRQGMSPDEVNAVCKKLEISPSQSQASSKIYMGSKSGAASSSKSTPSKLDSANSKKGH